MSDAPETPSLWVLLKESGEGDSHYSTVHAIYRTRESLEARVERIAKANRQYPLRPLGANRWVIGPEEDEGFFGNRPIYLRAVEGKFFDK